MSASSAVRDHHGKDESDHRGTPDVVVFPTSVQQVSELMKYANSNSIPVVPYGTGTGLEGGAVALQVGSL